MRYEGALRSPIYDLCRPTVTVYHACYNPCLLYTSRCVRDRQYTEAQLQKFKDDNERGVVYNGYRYTLYEAGQEQRCV